MSVNASNTELPLYIRWGAQLHKNDIGGDVDAVMAVDTRVAKVVKKAALLSESLAKPKALRKANLSDKQIALLNGTQLIKIAKNPDCPPRTLARIIHNLATNDLRLLELEKLLVALEEGKSDELPKPGTPPPPRVPPPALPIALALEMLPPLKARWLLLDVLSTKDDDWVGRVLQELEKLKKPEILQKILACEQFEPRFKSLVEETLKFWAKRLGDCTFRDVRANPEDVGICRVLRMLHKRYLAEIESELENIRSDPMRVKDDPLCVDKVLLERLRYLREGREEMEPVPTSSKAEKERKIHAIATNTLHRFLMLGTNKRSPTQLEIVDDDCPLSFAQYGRDEDWMLHAEKRREDFLFLCLKDEQQWPEKEFVASEDGVKKIRYWQKKFIQKDFSTYIMGLEGRLLTSTHYLRREEKNSPFLSKITNLISQGVLSLTALAQKLEGFMNPSIPFLIHAGWEGQIAILEACKALLEKRNVAPGIELFIKFLYNQCEEWRKLNRNMNFDLEPLPLFAMEEIVGIGGDRAKCLDWLGKQVAVLETKIEELKTDAAWVFYETEEIDRRFEFELGCINADRFAQGHKLSLICRFRDIASNHVDYIQWHQRAGNVTRALLDYYVRQGQRQWEPFVPAHPLLSGLVRALQFQQKIQLALKTLIAK